MRLRFALVLSVAMLGLPCGADDSTVTLSLADYEKLRGAGPEPVQGVGTIQLGGQFRDPGPINELAGRSIGPRSAIPVLEGAGALTIWGCSGGAIITRGDEQRFLLTPVDSTFKVRCRLATVGSDRIELRPTRSVLAVESAVGDGELVQGSVTAEGLGTYSLVRLSGGSGEVLASTATGRYCVTLLPDETRFRYEIAVHNPNRARQAFELNLRSGEHLQKIDAESSYEVEGAKYRFELPPGDSQLTLSGQLGESRFVPPVEASVQFVAVESHPLLRPAITGSVKRISASEAGIQTQFRGSQAFQLGKNESIEWKVTKLETTSTVSYALGGVRHVFYIPQEGPALGETIFAIDNQGASEVELPAAPESTYASLGGEPLPMTRGNDGSLVVPLSSGRQDLLQQHRQQFRPRAGFAGAHPLNPQLGVPATSLLVEIRYPRHWYPLVQWFGTRTKLWRPSSAMLLAFIPLLFWTERSLAFLGLDRRRRAVISGACALAAAASSAFALLLLLANGLVLVKWLAPRLRREKWTFARALAATGIVVVILVLVVVNIDLRQQQEAMYSSGTGGIASAPPAPAFLSDEARELVTESKAQQNAVYLQVPTAKTDIYKGLPARIELPTGERRSYFGQELLSVEHRQSVGLLMVSSTIVWWLQAVLVVIAIALVWNSRSGIADGLRRSDARERDAEEPPTPEEESVGG